MKHLKVALPRMQILSFLNVLRKEGYWITKESKEIEATKPFGKKKYPRFHLKIYRESDKGPSFLDLHIDWERPKHSQYWGKCATEDNETIRQETERLKSLLSSV